MFILINKPKDWTSFDVVGYIRKIARQSLKSVDPDNQKIRSLKVGHAGTLDPFATGLLIVGVGREATKRLDEFKNLPKTYVATIRLGAVSDTFDSTGVITNYKKSLSNCYMVTLLKKLFKKNNNVTIQQCNNEFNKIDSVLIQNVLNKFIGKIKQTPPMYSAKKINGQKLYDLARKGITIRRKKNKIEIYNIKLIEYNYPILKISVNCSAGTYIRTLANDIGEKLRVGAYCEELERTKIGEYSLDEAKSIADIKNLQFT
ncbi:MAG TPA: tRNA pseudouridine(55) synthase [Candidatus Magasanikbacteria bacterium]|nr:tRNA pseudouridine(55) synthase [Candidatus Magasanikbacteria bacterium]